jgi:hypothetical protein
MADAAAGLTLAICKDGQSTPTNHLPMGGFRHTSVGSATAATNYAQAGQVQAGGMTCGASSVGTDAYAITVTPAISAYAANQRFQIIVDVGNTGACTADINSLGPKAIKMQDGADPYTGAILASSVIDLIYDGTNLVLMSCVPVGAAGTVEASKAVVVDANKDIGDFRNLTATGTVASPTVNASTSLQIGGVAVTASAAELNYNDITTLGTTQASKVVTTTAGNVITAATITTLTSTTGNITTVNATNVNFGNENLNYYDQGTWTPTFLDSSLSTGEGQTYTSQSGYYTRIGNIVHVSGLLDVASIGSLTNGDQVRIGGFPFGAASSTDGIVIHRAFGMSASVNDMHLMGSFSGGGNTYCVLYKRDIGTPEAALTVLEFSTGTIYFSSTYLV